MATIPEFFTGRSVLITGVTGFLGKVLLEKLLYGCPGIDHIYVLIRSKKNQNAQRRLEDVLSSQLFDKIKRQMPDFTKKIIAIQGDIIMPGLGLSDHDLQKIRAEVSVIFHSAATIKFDEPLRLAIRMNILGLRHMLEVARKLKSLESLVHVSTAYSNCDQKTIHEEIYKPLIQPQDLVTASEWMTDDMFDILTAKLIQNKPNTYTFTKHLAEFLLQEERGSLPCCIVRPSIIGASWKHPFPGWVDNFNGSAGPITAIGKGLLRLMYGGHTNIADIIPVDICVNHLITAAWSTAVNKPSCLPVYHSTSGHLSSMTWGLVGDVATYAFIDYPVDSPYRVPNFKFTMVRPYKQISKYCGHFLPAFVVDAACRSIGMKARALRIQRRVAKATETVEYFTAGEWDFTTKNIDNLGQKLHQSDKLVFWVDMAAISWRRYLENYCLGIKQYALKENMDNLDKARRFMTQYIWAGRIAWTITILIGWRTLIKNSKIARDMWKFLVSLFAIFYKDMKALAKV